MPVAVRDGYEDFIVPIQSGWSIIDQSIEQSKTRIRDLSAERLAEVGMSGTQLRKIKIPILSRLIQGAYRAYNRMPEGVHKVIEAAAKALGGFLSSGSIWSNISCACRCLSETIITSKHY